MKELMKALKFIQGYVAAIRQGFDRAVAEIPDLTEQHIHLKAKQKLHSTLETYIQGVQVSMTDYVLVIEMDKDNWLANAIETGVDSWSLKQTHLNSPKAKTSKEGFRYLRIPMGKQAGAAGGPSEQSQRIQQKINEVMRRPKVGLSKYQTMVNGQLQRGIYPSGAVVETQAIMTDDPDISGLYRTRAFANAENFYQKQKTKKGMPTWQLVMFRTISDKPGTSPWIHPGLTGVKIFKETEMWLSTVVGDLVSERIKQSVQSFVGKGM
jgi:hypothetical protein